MSRPSIIIFVVALIILAPMAIGSGRTAQPGYVPVQMPGPAASEATVTVADGDHFWLISQRHLESQANTDVPDADVHHYWREMIEINLERIRSGDPDLIYPGEELLLPDP